MPARHSGEDEVVRPTPPVSGGLDLKPGILKRAWLRIARTAHPYFFVVGAQPHQPEDHLVDVVRRDPESAASLLRSIALFSAAGNVLAGGACTIFLSLYWSSCGNCDRPLRWWLLAQAFLQISQLPVRFALLASVHTAEGHNGLEQRIASLTASPAWRASKTAALLQYGWFVLGTVWWIHTEECPTCPGITKLVGGVMFLAVGRAVAALVIFRMLFTGNLANETVPKVMGATARQIAAIPTVTYKVQPGDEVNSCSICLCDFIDGTVVRKLPCSHEFHRRCVDKWLHRNKRCPLCIHAVDEPCPSQEQDQQCQGAHDQQPQHQPEQQSQQHPQSQPQQQQQEQHTQQQQQRKPLQQPQRPLSHLLPPPALQQRIRSPSQPDSPQSQGSSQPSRPPKAATPGLRLAERGATKLHGESGFLQAGHMSCI